MGLAVLQYSRLGDLEADTACCLKAFIGIKSENE